MHPHHPWWPHLISFPRPFDLLSWWWLSMKGYALSSSIGVGGGLWANAAHKAHEKNCHHHRCLFVGRFHHPDHGLLCKKHYQIAGGQIPGKHYQLETMPRGER